MEDEEYFKWAVLAAFYYQATGNDPERILKLRRFEGIYDWTGLMFPVTLNETGIFEQNNDVSVNVFGAIREEDLHSLEGQIQWSKNGQSPSHS